MSRLAKVYGAFLLGGGLLFAAPEAVPRNLRGLSRRDVGNAAAVAVAQWDEIERRLSHGKGRPGDDVTQLRTAERLHELRHEQWLRDAQTAVFLLLGVGSLGFLIAALPGAVRIRRGAPGGGLVEVMSDETIGIAEAALDAEIAKLAASRREAIARLEPAAHRCAYCGRRSRWKVLGRIGRRILVKRPPPGAKDLGLRLGEGWWFRAAAPDACRKCGSTDVVVA